MSHRSCVLIRPVRQEYDDLKRRIDGERRRRICNVVELPTK